MWPLIVTGVFICLSGCGYCSSPTLYFIDDANHQLLKMSTAGGTAERVVGDLAAGSWVAAHDPALGYIYWNNGRSRIGRLSLKTNITTYLDISEGRRQGMAVNYKTGEGYVTDVHEHTIQIFDFKSYSATPRRTIKTRTSGAYGPDGIVVDPESGWMYWTDESLRKVQKATMDGSDQQDVVANTGMMMTYGITLDKPADRLYFCGMNGVKSVKVDGSDSKTHFATTGGDYTFVGIAVDEYYIYLTSNKHSNVYRLSKTAIEAGSVMPLGQASHYKDRLFGLVLTNSTYVYPSTAASSLKTTTTSTTQETTAQGTTASVASSVVPTVRSTSILIIVIAVLCSVIALLVVAAIVWAICRKKRLSGEMSGETQPIPQDQVNYQPQSNVYYEIDDAHFEYSEANDPSTDYSRRNDTMPLAMYDGAGYLQPRRTIVFQQITSGMQPSPGPVYI